MHELSIAVSLVDAASEQMANHPHATVQTVRLRLGALSGVVRDALLFSFDLAAAGTLVEGARLAIEDVRAAVWCDTCQAERELADSARRRCPACDTLTPRLVRGEELELVGLEIRDR